MSQRNLTNMNSFPFHVFCRWTHASYHSMLSFNDGLMNLVSRKQRFEKIRTIAILITYQMSTLNIIILDLFVDILEAILFTCIVLKVDL